MNNRFPEKSCLNCEHCQTYSHGGTYYEPPNEGWECDIEEADKNTVFRLIELHDTKAATWCKHYQVQMITSCPSCYKKINSPRHEWKIWCDSWDCDPFPVCSEECKNEEDRKSKEYADELRLWNTEVLI